MESERIRANPLTIPTVVLSLECGGCAALLTHRHNGNVQAKLAVDGMAALSLRQSAAHTQSFVADRLPIG